GLGDDDVSDAAAVGHDALASSRQVRARERLALALGVEADDLHIELSAYRRGAWRLDRDRKLGIRRSGEQQLIARVQLDPAAAGRCRAVVDVDAPVVLRTVFGLAQDLGDEVAAEAGAELPRPAPVGRHVQRSLAA